MGIVLELEIQMNVYITFLVQNFYSMVKNEFSLHKKLKKHVF